MKGIEVVNTKAQSAIAIRKKVRMEDIPQEMGRIFGELVPLLQGSVQCAGPPFAMYHSWSDSDTDMEVGFPISGEGITKGNVKTIELPAVKAAVLVHVGPYDKLVESYNEMLEWMKANGHQPADFMWEEYLNSPDDTPLEGLMTRMVWPIK